jgi:hypothetical protein
MRIRPWLAILILLAVACPARETRAVGACEGLEVRYALTAVAVPAGLLTFEVTVPFCQDADEDETKAILVIDLELGARRGFASPRHGPAATAVQERNEGGPARALPGVAPLVRDHGDRRVKPRLLRPRLLVSVQEAWVGKFAERWRREG